MGVAMMGVDRDGTILLLALAAEPASLRFMGPSAFGGGVIDGISRKAEIAGPAPAAALE
jgi:hypothetical protein